MRSWRRSRNGRTAAGVGRSTPTLTACFRAVVERLAGRWRPLLFVAIFAGLRASELRGLRWSDVDLKKATVQVRQRVWIEQTEGAKFWLRVTNELKNRGIGDIPSWSGKRERLQTASCWNQAQPFRPVGACGFQLNTSTSTKSASTSKL